MMHRILACCLLFFLYGCNMLDPAARARELNKTALKYSRKEDRQEAIKYFYQASQVEGITDSQRTLILENMGNEYRHYKTDSAKYYYYQAACVNNRNSYNWLFSMANCYLMDKRTDSALPLLIRAGERDSMGMQNNNILGCVYMGEYGEGYTDLVKALKYNLRYDRVAQSATSAFTLAKNYYLLNDTTRSVQLFEEIYQKYPNYTPALGSLIMVYKELGRSADAETMLDDLKKKDYARYKRVVAVNIKAGEHGLTWHY